MNKLFKLFRKAPSRFGFRIIPEGAGVYAASDESLLQSALNQGIAFPHSCRAGGCGACKCRLVHGKVKELTDKSYLLSKDELDKNFILACQSIPKSDITVEVTLERGRPEHEVVSTEATIVGIKTLTPDILEIELLPEKFMTYTAGQFANVSWPPASNTQQPVERSYSFANTPYEDANGSTLHFYIKKVVGGKFTERLFSSAEVGVKLALQGPYGNFYLRPGVMPIIAIAGGSGLAPIKAILEQAIKDKKSNRNVVLFFGARTRKDLYGLQALAEIRRHWLGRFELITVLSDEPLDSDWTGPRGLITEHIAKVSKETLSESQAYLCGPPPMVDSCISALAHAGLDQSAIYCDKFLDASYGAR